MHDPAMSVYVYPTGAAIASNSGDAHGQSIYKKKLIDGSELLGHRTLTDAVVLGMLWNFK